LRVLWLKITRESTDALIKAKDRPKSTGLKLVVSNAFWFVYNQAILTTDETIFSMISPPYGIPKIWEAVSPEKYLVIL
jgi:hypothetical protein